MELDKKEFDYIKNTDFLITKFSIIGKIIQTYANVEQQLREIIKDKENLNHSSWFHKTGKISKGENYRLLPYVVLDYPRYFTKEEVFSFRSMFWWGNFFSCSFHLKGKFLENMKEKVFQNLLADPKDLFICVNDSPWEYHYETNNYQLVTKLDVQELREVVFGTSFLKISKKIDIDQYDLLPEFCIESFHQFLRIIEMD